MNKFIFVLISLLLTSCNHKSNLQEEFMCDNYSFDNTEIVSDFKNKFSLEIPKKWKTQLYFNNLQTQIFTADTTKNLTNTYTLNFEYNNGNLIINDDFKTKIIKTNIENNFTLLKSNKDIFKDKSAIWFISKGKKLSYDLFYFELYVKQSKINYYKITSEIYGNENLNDRLCKSLSIIETLKTINSN